jgi:hypothetical protein
MEATYLAVLVGTCIGIGAASLYVVHRLLARD